MLSNFGHRTQNIGDTSFFTSCLGIYYYDEDILGIFIYAIRTTATIVMRGRNFWTTEMKFEKELFFVIGRMCVAAILDRRKLQTCSILAISPCYFYRAIGRSQVAVPTHGPIRRTPHLVFGSSLNRSDDIG